MAAFVFSDNALAPPGLGKVISVRGPLATVEYFDSPIDGLTAYNFDHHRIPRRPITAPSCDGERRRYKPMLQPSRVVP